MKPKKVKKYKIDKTNTKQPKNIKIKVRQTKAMVKPGLKMSKEKIVITQAERIVKKFGGVAGLEIALRAAGKARDISNIYRWIYKGLVPSKALMDILLAAKYEGIRLSSDDLSPIPNIKVIHHHRDDKKNRNVPEDGELLN